MKKIVICITVIALCLASLTCIASCKEKESEYTVTFYNNKGIYFYTNNKGEERMVLLHQNNDVYEVVSFSGKYPPEPTPPKYSGYVFLGWYQNPECTEEFLFGHYEVQSDINLYAKWGKKS